MNETVTGTGVQDGRAAPSGYEPAQWLRELARLKRSAWPWRRSIRAALCVGAPLAAGFVTGDPGKFLWLALGAMITAASEGEGAYWSRFRQLAIATPIAACGFLFGYLDAVPYPWVIAAGAAAAFAASVISRHGAAWSTGCMQCLVFASIVVGLPEAGPPLESMALYICGVAIFAAALGMEALIDRNRPERKFLAQHVDDLACLARLRAEIPDGQTSDAFEAARRRLIDQSRDLYAALLQARRNGRTQEIVRRAGLLDAADNLFHVILAASDQQGLNLLSAWLEQTGEALRRRRPPPPCAWADNGEGLCAAARLLRARMLGQTGFSPPEGASSPPGLPWISPASFAIGPSVLANASAVALCMALALAMKYVLPPNHWYWAPLTVALVMKPDLGSVFARAVLRSAGTLAGVVIGVLVLHLLPKGPGLVIAITLLAACLPWAKGVSYAVMVVALTPLVLVLLDLMTPGAATTDLAPERLVNTAIGSAISLVFGYFLWPRSHARELSAEFSRAMDAVSAYLLAVCGADKNAVWPAGRACYVRLSEMRAILARCMAEPPPAGREAAAWFPVIADAERMCDRISAWSAQSGAAPPQQEAERVAQLLRTPPQSVQSVLTAPTADPFLRDIVRQYEGLRRRLE